MNYEQFWEQDAELVKFYQKAARIKQDLKNQDAWLHGLYIYEALMDVSPALRSMGAKKPSPYRKEPFELTVPVDKKDKLAKEKKNDQQAKQFMEAFAIAHNKNFNSQGGDVSGK